MERPFFFRILFSSKFLCDDFLMGEFRKECPAAAVLTELERTQGNDLIPLAMKHRMCRRNCLLLFCLPVWFMKGQLLLFN